jgi:hypothetical protein
MGQITYKLTYTDALWFDAAYITQNFTVVKKALDEGLDQANIDQTSHYTFGTLSVNSMEMDNIVSTGDVTITYSSNRNLVIATDASMLDTMIVVNSEGVTI